MRNYRCLVPNSITTANVMCGFAAILFSIQGNFAYAAWGIIFAGLFDLFDGRVARLMNASSSFGQEYDTLSDMLSFGVAPALLFYQFTLASMGLVGAAVAFLYLFCVMFRLARFTVSEESVNQVAPNQTPNQIPDRMPNQISDQKHPSTAHFQGLSSPVSAATTASFILFASLQSWDAAHQLQYATSLLTFLALLMISNLKFPSFKKVNWKSTGGITTLAILAVLFIIALMHPSLYVFPILMTLLACALIYDVALRIRASSEQSAAALKINS